MATQTPLDLAAQMLMLRDNLAVKYPAYSDFSSSAEEALITSRGYDEEISALLRSYAQENGLIRSLYGADTLDAVGSIMHGTVTDAGIASLKWLQNTRYDGRSLFIPSGNIRHCC